MYIDGRWVDSGDSATLEVLNPANQEVLALIPKASREDARRAIEAAFEATERASKLAAHERSRILLKVASLLEQNSREMAVLIARNVGKPLVDAEAETARAVLTITFAGEEAKRIYGQTIPLDAHPIPAGNENRLGFTIREPVGVVGAISPFNFPLNLLMHKVAPAIAAGNTVVASTFGYSGQVCTATRRISLSEGVRGKFLTHFEESVNKLRVGNPLERTTNVGPIINRRGLEKIERLVEDATARGAVAKTGGARLVSGEYSRGNFYAPTVLDKVDKGMEIASKEIFGPVAAIMKVTREDDFADAANSTVYGLQASIFTSNLARGIKLARKVKAGAVLINDRTNLRWDNAPFGGVKMSGMGREGVSLAVTELTDLKFIVANLGES